MFNLWKTNAIVFILQSLAGLPVWYFSEKNIYAAFIAVALVAIILIISASLAPVALSAMVFALLVAGTTGLTDNTISVTSIVVFAAIAITLFFAVPLSIKKGGAPEPTWVLFLTALPAGVGAFLGGMLYYAYFRQRPTKSAAT